jgi:hypothetical protein
MHTLSKPQAFGAARKLLCVGLLTAVAGGGCQTATGTGAAAGGALGAGIGALASHCPGGALVGGLIGAGAGALGGAAVDSARERKAERAAAYDAAVRAPSLEDVVKMTQAGVPAGTIIEQVRTSGVVYRLSADQVVWLTQQGVQPAVIQSMQDTVYRTRPPAYAPVYAPPPGVVVVEQVPPPVAVGVGFSGRFR